MARSIRNEEENNLAKIEEVKQASKKYEEISASFKSIKSKEEVSEMIVKLQENGLYDDSHPYLVVDSPFYLSTT